MNEPICQVNAKSGQFLSGKHEVLPCNFRSANRRSSGNSQLSSLEICSEFLCVTAFRTSARVLERLVSCSSSEFCVVAMWMCETRPDSFLTEVCSVGELGNLAFLTLQQFTKPRFLLAQNPSQRCPASDGVEDFGHNIVRKLIRFRPEGSAYPLPGLISPGQITGSDAGLKGRRNRNICRPFRPGDRAEGGPGLISSGKGRTCPPRIIAMLPGF